MENGIKIAIILVTLAIIASVIYTLLIGYPNMIKQQSKYISSCKSHGFLYDANKPAYPMSGWCYQEDSYGVRTYLIWDSDTDSWSVNR